MAWPLRPWSTVDGLSARMTDGVDAGRRQQEGAAAVGLVDDPQAGGVVAESSAAPSVMESSTSPIGRRCEIDRWMRKSRSSSVWRSWSTATSRWFSSMWARASGCSARSLSRARSIRSAWASTRPMPRSSSASSEANGSPERATRRVVVQSTGTATVAQSPTPGTWRTGASPWPAAPARRRADGAERRRRGDVPGPEPDRGEHHAVLHDGADLGLHGLGRPFDGAVEGGRVRPRRPTRRPGTRRAAGRATPTERAPGQPDAQPTASTTRVWLWKPLMPWVRAISP